MSWIFQPSKKPRFSELLRKVRLRELAALDWRDDPEARKRRRKIKFDIETADAELASRRQQAAEWQRPADDCQQPRGQKRKAEGQLSSYETGGHDIRTDGTFHWCNKCGAFAESVAKRLSQRCGGRPANATAASRREGMRNGLHPTAERRLQDHWKVRHCDLQGSTD